MVFALEVWRGLAAGRWSLVDHFDRDGKRFLLVVKNGCGTPAALTSRERRVCELAARGYSDKQIAHHLGSTMAAVAGSLHRARRKLGARTRVELTRAWKHTLLAAAG